MLSRSGVLAALLALSMASAAFCDIEEFHATEIKPIHSDQVKPVKSTPVKPVQAKTIKAYKAKVLPVPPKYRQNVPLSFFYGGWKMAVPGTAYTTDNYATNTRKLTISAGAKTRGLRINPNGTYSWAGISGRWKKSGQKDYPIVLQHGKMKRDWKVGYDSRSKGIFVWDGYTWEVGRRG